MIWPLLSISNVRCIYYIWPHFTHTRAVVSATSTCKHVRSMWLMAVKLYLLSSVSGNSILAAVPQTFINHNVFIVINLPGVAWLSHIFGFTDMCVDFLKARFTIILKLLPHFQSEDVTSSTHHYKKKLSFSCLMQRYEHRFTWRLYYYTWVSQFWI